MSMELFMIWLALRNDIEKSKQAPFMNTISSDVMACPAVLKIWIDRM